MKRIYSILLLILVCSAMTVHAENEPSYLTSIEIREGGVLRKDRTVQLTMAVNLSKAKIRAQHTVALTPVLVAADGSREMTFPPIVIDGKIRNKVYLRAQRLQSMELPPYHDEAAQVIIRRRNGKPQDYDYTASVPYEHWMLNGRIEIREEIHGCANCGEAKTEQTVWATVLPAYVPDYRIDRIAPEHESVKVRAETRTARLQFRQDSYHIRPDYKHNRSELDTVFSSIELIKKNSDVSITGIYITGYASPEGAVTHNLLLSEKRAQALADYICRHNKIDMDMLHVDWKGEDWEGFRLALDKFPKLLKRDEVLRIIDECTGDRDICEQRLQELVPTDIYHRLLNEVYPLLRRNEYKIEYNVRHFNIEEAKQHINTYPDLLSVDEIYKVAESYDKGTDEYREAILTAARTYPDNIPAVVNAARMEMEGGNIPSAIRLLESSRVSDTPEVLNALGVAYAKSGQYDKALELLERAKASGSAEAETNLQQVAGMMDDL